MQLAVQGQSMFQASGDNGANSIQYASDSQWVTSVGGTRLNMSGNGQSYTSEIVWNTLNVNNPPQGAGASCGGVSGQFAIPFWQQNVNMTAAGGSTIMRDVPDVAAVADDLFIFDSGVTNDGGGTSFASPLWAAFTALINQQLQADNLPPVGFLNPIIYYIGSGPASYYTSAFHDITVGNNETPSSPNRFSAGPGYDLCTGWGSPNGMGLINTIVSLSPLIDQVSPPGIWVDFNSGLDPDQGGNGYYWTPFRTLTEALQDSSPGNTIWIRTAGSSGEKPSISTAVTIRVYGGAATIGHQ
jgi:subtilase family serine protease